jgi:hypothetical protein
MKVSITSTESVADGWMGGRAQEDVVNNSFNILRMFLYIYGSQEGPIMLVSQHGTMFCSSFRKFLVEWIGTMTDHYSSSVIFLDSSH